MMKKPFWMLFLFVFTSIPGLVFGQAFSYADSCATCGGGYPAGSPKVCGTPIYANQGAYYGLPQTDCTANQAVGVNVGGDCGTCAPCGPCGVGGGFLNRLWNGQAYWQGAGCSERVIDELRKSWHTCPRCTLEGENVAVSPNSMGTGLRSYQLLNASNPYPQDVNMYPGMENQLPNGTYIQQTPDMTYPQSTYQQGAVYPQAAPVAAPNPGCKSCQKGTTAYAPAPQNVQSMQNVQPVQYVQPVQNTQPVQYVQPAQYVPPTQPAARSGSRNSEGKIHYRSFYPPARSENVPGYIRAQQNANAQMGIGLDDVPSRAPAPEAENAPQGEWVVVKPVQYTNTSNLHYVANTPETIPTPVPRTSRAVALPPVANSPSVAYPQQPVQTAVMPSPVSPDVMAGGYIPGDCGPDCGVPCEPCGPFAGPFAGPLAGPCGPMGCGEFPGLIPLAGRAVYNTGAVAVRTGQVVVNTGRIAVVGTGRVAVGGLRLVGKLLYNGPAPAWACGPGWCGGPICGGPVCGPACDTGCAPGADFDSDPVYEMNDRLLNGELSSVPTSNNVPTYVQNTAPAGSGTAGLLSTQPQRVVLDDGTEVILEHDSNRVPARNIAAAYSTQQQTAPRVGDMTSDGARIVAAEAPNIQLAPGEVLISEQDMILEPQETYQAKPEAAPAPTEAPAPSEFRAVSYVQETRLPAPEPSFLKLKAATPMN